MNNSKLAFESVYDEKEVDRKPYLRLRSEELAKILDAIDNVCASNYWNILKEHVFDGVLESLYRKMANENNENEIYRLQGQIMWADKYSDLKKIAIVYRNELQNIQKQLNSNREENIYG